MMKRKTKRYEEGGDIDEMEAANERTDRMLMPNERGAAGTSETMYPSEKPKAKMVTKEELAKSGMSLRDYLNKQQGLTRKGGSSTPETGDESSRLAGRYAKPALRQETMRERAEAYNAKRFAQQAEDAAKDMAPRGQSRILTGIRKNAGGNVGMGAGMKSGGSVSSASKRADGIAMRGKTRGKMC